MVSLPAFGLLVAPVTAQASLAASWAGIDACSSGSTERNGTLAHCYGGRAYQYTW